MKRRGRQTALGACAIALVAAGAGLLASSYSAHARMLEYLRIGDRSAAEIPEIEMWATALAGAAALVACGALAGLALGRGRPAAPD